MRISIIGTGYVGLVTGMCFVAKGFEVICIDTDSAKIKSLQEGRVPFFESGLDEMVKTGLQTGRVHFTTDATKGITSSDVTFIAVGTPPLPNGDVDMTQVQQAAHAIGNAISRYTVVVNKSTTPPGTGDWLEQEIGRVCLRELFDVVSNPEFLRQGSAVDDALRPERIVIGSDSQRALEILRRLYRPFSAPMVETDRRTAELIKYACNAFLATKISFINEISTLCERTGADIRDVARAMELDSRIGKGFLNAGIGYGGSCFPKDTQALARFGRNLGTRLGIVEATIRANQQQRLRFVKGIEYALHGLRGTVLGVLGLSFKPSTDDMRDAPSVTIINELVRRGANVQAYDPVAVPKARLVLGDRVRFVEDEYAAADGADGLLILVEWPQFRQLNWLNLAHVMKAKRVFDGRNFLADLRLIELGFEYWGVGLQPQKDMAVVAEAATAQE